MSKYKTQFLNECYPRKYVLCTSSANKTQLFTVLNVVAGGDVTGYDTMLRNTTKFTPMEQILMCRHILTPL